jgi:tRNA modification GTPase
LKSQWFLHLQKYINTSDYSQKTSRFATQIEQTNMNRDTTICAIATAPGNGAIAVIRLSGKNAISITDRVFISPSQKKLTNQKANTVHFGSMVNNGEIVDDVLVSLFRAPLSYTGEDIVEISCHGSIYIQQQILQLLISTGAEMAQPGEFTLRAFLNGKMDLSQAEAVADLISSESKAAHQIAVKQLRGEFNKQIGALRTNLLDFSSLIELELDFSEEDVEFANRDSLKNNIAQIRKVLGKLVKSFSLGNVIKNGVPVAIVGQPNVGKSTLLNALLQEEKAIVSEIAGTTRDAIEDVVNIEGIRFRFIDTAGIRNTTDKIESIGIERTFAKINQARVILLLVEASQTPESIGKQIAEINITPEQNLIVVVNKIDLYPETDVSTVLGGKNGFAPYPTQFLSAKKHIHTQELTSLLLKTIQHNKSETGDVVISNVRHYEALTKALEAAERVASGLETGISSDFVAMDIRGILHHLGEITGDITTDDILGNIFSKFCIGK